MTENSRSVGTYKLPVIKSTSTLDLISNMLYLYSTYFTLTGKGLKPLRPLSVKVLSIYILYGYNTESKDMAVDMCGLKNKNRLDVVNKELRDSGYLVKSKGNDRNSHLNDDLIPLSESFSVLNLKMSDLKNAGVNSIKMSMDFDCTLP